jgi:hemerythrin superfamily protein
VTRFRFLRLDLPEEEPVKSIAQQNRSELGGWFSVLVRQKRDHIKLDALLNQLSSDSAGEQDRTLRRIYRLVFPHAFAEEAVLWPAVRRVLPAGHDLTLRVELEHQQINELVTRLESLDHSAHKRPETIDAVIELLRMDVRDEEDLLLPRLHSRLSLAQLRRLGLAWEIVRLVAPTRAHPIVSRRPPGNVLSALPLSVLDRCRDGVEGLLHRAPEAAAGPLRTVGAALARASRLVEQLPGMRSGEDPSTRVALAPRFGWSTAVVAVAGGAAVLLALARHRKRRLG